MTKPITPAEVANAKKNVTPTEVIEVFNEEIARKFSNGSATVRQDEIVKLVCAKMRIAPAAFVTEWLNVEELYEAAGWSVAYDKPGYNETYPATFTFKKKRARS